MLFPSAVCRKCLKYYGKNIKTEPIYEEQHNEWKSSGAFNKGIAVITGTKAWHNSKKIRTVS